MNGRPTPGNMHHLAPMEQIRGCLSGPCRVTRTFSFPIMKTTPPSSVVYHQGEGPGLPQPSQGPLTSISVTSGSSGAQGGVGEAGGMGSASELLSSVVESVPEESVGSMAARLSRDTLVQAEDRLRFRHQCIGSWDMRGSTLGRRKGQEGQGVAPAGHGPSRLPVCTSPSPSDSIPTTFFLLHSRVPLGYWPPACLSSVLSSPSPPLPPAPTVGLVLCRRQRWGLGPHQGATNPPVERHSLLFLRDPLDWAGHPPRSLGDQLGAALDPRRGVPGLMDLFGLPDCLHHHSRHGMWGARLPGAPSSETIHLF